MDSGMRGFTAGRGAPPKASGLLSTLVDIWMDLGKGAKIGILALVFLAITGAVCFSWVHYASQNINLYTQMMAQADVPEVSKKLTESLIPHQVNATRDGILISPKLRSKAQMLLASKGLPRHPFKENLGEISESLRRLEGVADAYVKIDEPTEQFFKDDKVPKKATVMLKRTPGTQLTESQLAAVVQVVTQGVPDLEQKNVRVVDTQMNVLTATFKQSEGSTKQTPMESAKASELTRRAQKQLDDVFGPDKTKVAVNVEYNLNQVERTPSIKRITCNIAANNLKEDQVAKIGGLVQNAIGWTPERGDQMSITSTSLPFARTPLGTAEGSALLQEMNRPPSSETGNPNNAGLLGIILFATSLAALGLIGVFLMKQHRVQVT